MQYHLRFQIRLLCMLGLLAASVCGIAVAGADVDSSANAKAKANATAAADAAEAEWELQRDRDGVSVYTRAVKGSRFKEVKSVMTIEAKPGELVALIRDTQACNELSKLCKQAYEHKVVSETELYVYNLNDLPWPVSDRDAVTHVIWSRDANSGAVTMVARVTGGVLPEQPRTVRLTYGVTKWTFTPLKDDQVEVVSEAHIDPEGRVPAWITNMLLVDSPFDTMVNVRKLIVTGRYRDASFAFLSEDLP